MCVSRAVHAWSPNNNPFCGTIFFKSVPHMYCINVEREFGTTPTTPMGHEAHNRLNTPPKHQTDLYDLTERVQDLTLRS
jgi:hypothetical protein